MSNIGYPYTYGDDRNDRKMLSDYIVDAAKNERVQKHLGSVAAALFTLAMYIQSASAIPPEYGEAANEMLNQAAQNGAAAGGVPAVPPIGEIQGQVPVAQGNPQWVIPAMPIEQQRLIAAQQAGQMGPILGPGAGNPSDPPSLYITDKPM